MATHRRIAPKTLAFFAALILSACGGGGGGGSSIGGGGEPVSFSPSSAALPPPQTPTALTDDSVIAIGGGGDTFADLAGEIVPLAGAVEIAGGTNQDLASEWRLLPLEEKCVLLCDNGIYTDDVTVTIGMVYKADGDKIAAAFFREADGASVVTFSLAGKAAVDAALGLGGGGHEITLAYYDGELPAESSELIRLRHLVTGDTPRLAPGDDSDALIFQNQYSLLSFWLYPALLDGPIHPGFRDSPLGLPTPDSQIPNGGVARYRGIAAGYGIPIRQLKEFFFYGTSGFTADFFNASLSGSITVSAYDADDLARKLGGGAFGEARGTIGADFSDLAIGGDGSFSGVPVYSPANNAANLGVFAAYKKENLDEFIDGSNPRIKGDFYGPDAEEIAGEMSLQAPWVNFDFTADKQ